MELKNILIAIQDAAYDLSQLKPAPGTPEETLSFDLFAAIGKYESTKK